MRATAVFFGLMILAAPSVSRACHVAPRIVLTRENGMNAVILGGGPKQTLADLLDRRAMAPKRFDFNHPRIGNNLKSGLEGLLDKQALNPKRFNRNHPVLSYLLRDITPNGAGPINSGTGGPNPPSVLTSSLGPPSPGVVPTISVVPEPSTLALGAGALVVIASIRARRWRRSAKD